MTIKFEINGLVQGIGYRPFIASLLGGKGFCGRVINAGGIVNIYINVEDEDEAESIKEMLLNNYPEGAIIEDVSYNVIDNKKFNNFDIDISNDSGKRRLLPADIGICEDCKKELFDKSSRRYLYPLISCAKCGPRYSIMTAVPYDRSSTTMANMLMCPKCLAEYKDYGDRRGYAQTNSCPECEPNTYLSENGKVIASNYIAMEKTISLLRDGEVVALMDVGGFHLVCDANNKEAVNKLRKIKKRETKPFAVCVFDIDNVRDIAVVGDEEEKLLSSPARPVVLLDSLGKLSTEVCFDSPYVGVMLPANGYQAIITKMVGPVVMTSANITGMPMLKDYIEAEKIADYVLYNDREIVNPSDDSIMRIVEGELQTLRRGRGIVPAPISDEIISEKQDVYLGFGADMKAAACLYSDNDYYLLPPVEDAGSLEARERFMDLKNNMVNFLQINPSLVAGDHHPAYFSYQEARRWPHRLFWHHKAHFAHVLLEEKITGNAIGIVFDGTGYGPDKTICGGEIFIKDGKDCMRVGHLKSVKMPSGDETSKNPAIPLAAYKALAGVPAESATEKLIFSVLSNDFNCVPISSAGRLFDAVSFLLKAAEYNNYEGEAPASLEYLASRAENKNAFSELRLNTSMESGRLVGDTPSFIKDIISLNTDDCNKAELAYAFHRALAKWIADVVIDIKNNYLRRLSSGAGDIPVCLSGGCFANKILLLETKHRLEEEGFRVCFNHILPPGDDSIAAGQLYLMKNDIN